MMLKTEIFIQAINFVYAFGCMLPVCLWRAPAGAAITIFFFAISHDFVDRFDRVRDMFFYSAGGFVAGLIFL